MIASGIILAVAAYREQLAGIPVVVRLRGTNQDEGQKMVSLFLLNINLKPMNIVN